MDDAVDHLFAGLDPATLAVREMIAGSREMVGRMAARAGMSANDMSAIGALVQHGSMGLSQLADHLGIRSASATEMVDRLERSGHVRRVREAGDRRRVRVSATDAARATSLQAWLPLVRGIDEVGASLSAPERATVLAFFARITTVVTDLDH